MAASGSCLGDDVDLEMPWRCVFVCFCLGLGSLREGQEVLDD